MGHTTNSALLTDLYQLSMLNGYMQRGMDDVAVFEFFVRRLPKRRNFLMASGLELALDFLEGFRFTPNELEWMASTERFSPQFIEYLAALRFTPAMVLETVLLACAATTLASFYPALRASRMVIVDAIRHGR